MTILKIIAWAYIALQFTISYAALSSKIMEEDKKKPIADRFKLHEIIAILIVRGVIHISLFALSVYIITSL